jgi:lysophospholipase L1-like esterase
MVPVKLLLPVLIAAAAGAQAQEWPRRYKIEPGPSHFAVEVPQGTYRVTLTFGGGAEATLTTVKAEARRLMLEDVRTSPRKTEIRSMIVNVRTPALEPLPQGAPGGTSVHLKDRELGSPTWDEKLSLEFIGPASGVHEVDIEPADVPTVYLVGDSTVTDQQAEPAASWGQMLPRFFRPDVAVANHAESGETLKSFITELRLAKALSHVKAGDWLIIQFGHNDEKKQWPQTYADPRSTYPAYLRVFIAEARLRGATPILVTPTERRNFDASGHIVPSHGDYPEAVRAVAREEKVGLIDLTRMTTIFYEALGPVRAPLAFNDSGRDKTHHNNYGAYEIARMVAASLFSADPRLAEHLLPAGREFDAARPDSPEHFKLSASAEHSEVRPDGN